MHFQGVRHLIRRRGGMRGLRTNGQFMENVMYWYGPMCSSDRAFLLIGSFIFLNRVDFSRAPKAIFSAGLPWTSSIPDERPESLPFLAPPLDGSLNVNLTFEVYDTDTVDIMQSCEDFLSFFRSLHEIQHILLHRSLPPSRDAKTGRGRVKLFEPSTPLYYILTSLPDYDHGIRDVRFIDEYTCMACLLYLNVTLYNYYTTSRNFDSYLEWVDLEMRESNPRLDLSVASLLWIFLRNGGFPSDEIPDEGERSWSVSRMLWVAKRLEWKDAGTIWDGLRSLLVQFLLTQQECGFGRDNVCQEELSAREQLLLTPAPILWDEAEMRQNILGQLYKGTPAFASGTEWVYPVHFTSANSLDRGA